MVTYSLVKIRLAGGEETPRFEATVVKHLDTGATITGLAFVSNGGMGGCCHWHWCNKGAEEEFAAFIKAKYPDEKFEPEDTWAYGQLDAFEHTRRLMRMSLKRTVFSVEGDKADEFRTLSRPYAPDVLAFIKTKFPGLKAKVFNRSTKQFVEVA
jgi:hypothetical protein